MDAASPWALPLADERARGAAIVLGTLVLVLGLGAPVADLHRRTRSHARSGN